MTKTLPGQRPGSAGCRKSPMDFFDSLHNASLFCLRSGPKSCRCAAQTPADTGFLQAFDPTRGGSRAPLRLCDSRPLLGRQSYRFLETGSLFPPLAALRQFPPRTPPAKKDSFPSDRVFRQAAAGRIFRPAVCFSITVKNFTLSGQSGRFVVIYKHTSSQEGRRCPTKPKI